MGPIFKVLRRMGTVVTYKKVDSILLAIAHAAKSEVESQAFQKDLDRSNGLSAIFEHILTL